jgi:hypothetical protein
VELPKPFGAAFDPIGIEAQFLRLFALINSCFSASSRRMGFTAREAEKLRFDPD